MEQETFWHSAEQGLQLPHPALIHPWSKLNSPMPEPLAPAGSEQGSISPARGRGGGKMPAEKVIYGTTHKTTHGIAHQGYSQ